MLHHKAQKIFLTVALSVGVGSCEDPPSFEDLNSVTRRLIASNVRKTEFRGQKVELNCPLSSNFHLPEGFDIRQHVLVSNSEGKLPDYRNDDSVTMAFRAILGGFADWVDRAKPEKPRLLLYFNGGLNSESSVVVQAARQVPCMLNDGVYPIFMVWNTDFFSSYWEQASKIYNGQRFTGGWVPWTTPFRILGHVISGIGHAPADYISHGRRFWSSQRREPKCQMMVHVTTESGCAEEQIINFVDAGIDAEHNGVIDKSNIDEFDPSTFQLLMYGAAFPVRVISTPLARGIGERAWANMIRRTRVTVRRSAEYNLDWLDPEHGRDCPKSFRNQLQRFPKGTGVFARFFQYLEDYYKSDQPRRLVKVSCNDDKKTDGPADQPTATVLSLVKRIHEALSQRHTGAGPAGIILTGHSMGAIVINELVPRFPELPYSDVVFMGAAASVRDTQRMLESYFALPKHQEERRFFNLTLHPLNDVSERQGFGLVPSGSLLAWIDELYEEPKTPADRVIGYWPTAKAARRLFSPHINENSLFRVFNAMTAGAGQFMNPVSHGQFNDDEFCFWRPAFWGVSGTTWETRYKDLPESAWTECFEKMKSE